MKKYILSFFFALAFLFAPAVSQAAFSATLPQQVRVVFNFTRIFETNQNLELLSNEELDEVTIKLALLGDVFDVLEQENDFYLITLQHNEESITGYIFKAAVIDNAIKSPEKFLQTNAKIIKTSSVFKFEDNTHVKIENITLESGTQVRLLQEMSAKNKYTLISFNLNEQTLTYYVETKNLKANGMSRSILTAITLIIVSISAGSVLLKIFKRKNNNIKQSKKHA